MSDYSVAEKEETLSQANERLRQQGSAAVARQQEDLVQPEPEKAVEGNRLKETTPILIQLDQASKALLEKYRRTLEEDARATRELREQGERDAAVREVFSGPG